MLGQLILPGFSLNTLAYILCMNCDCFVSVYSWFVHFCNKYRIERYFFKLLNNEGKIHVGKLSQKYSNVIIIMGNAHVDIYVGNECLSLSLHYMHYNI